jgi:hypothetical protein
MSCMIRCYDYSTSQASLSSLAKNAIKYWCLFQDLRGGYNLYRTHRFLTKKWQSCRRFHRRCGFWKQPITRTTFSKKGFLTSSFSFKIYSKVHTLSLLQYRGGTSRIRISANITLHPRLTSTTLNVCLKLQKNLTPQICAYRDWVVRWIFCFKVSKIKSVHVLCINAALVFNFSGCLFWKKYK